ncbi:MAG: DUF814 domain-containing protein [Cyclobacteriaceae bacterium]
MFHNYFFLKRLAKHLNPKLQGKQLLECFTQNKDELILGFADETESFYIRANLTPSISLLHFSNDFKRAKKNSLSLFETLINKQVKNVEAFKNERSFYIDFSDESKLVFKMHGSRSNILLFSTDGSLSLFRNVLINDTKLEFHSFDNDLTISEERLSALEYDVRQFLPALGKEVNDYLHQLGYQQQTQEGKWQMLNQLLIDIEQSDITILQPANTPPQLSLLPTLSGEQLQFKNAVEAANKYYELFTKDFYLNNTRRNARKPIVAEIKKTNNYLSKTKTKLNEITQRRGYDEIANILMANLHQIPKGSNHIVLDDFYNNEKIRIKLNPELSPQKNAENLYRKSKNQRMEIEKLEENISNRETKLRALNAQLEAIDTAQDLKELKNLSPKKAISKTTIILPYHEYAFREYQIMVGKNAKANDELTLKVAKSNDLWLHAKDVAGSHVVIRQRAGQGYPRDVIEHAAQLAAWFSKRKTDSLCPVIHTAKKNVRKRKGDPVGAVVVSREEIIMVRPQNFQ